MPHRVVGIYRDPNYSPLQHRVNDTAILDATLTRLAPHATEILRTTESAVAQGYLPDAELYLNMCQGSLAAEQLMPLEADGAIVVNRPSSALNCHRHRLVARLAGSTIAFPQTVVVSSAAALAGPLQSLSVNGHGVWVKRGDVHAERPEDVVAAGAETLESTVQAFRERGIPWVALQEHVPGPILKFYGVADGRFFRWYGAEAGPGGPRPTADEDRLKALAFDAAAMLGLEVFGGDVALPEPDRPVLIDINDWPSFAPFREDGARAISSYVLERLGRRRRA